MDSAPQTRHVERLTASPAWWGIVVVFALVVGWLLLVATPTLVAAVVTLVLLAAGAGALWRAGSIAVVAEPGSLRAGDAHLETPHLGAVDALDRDAWRAAMARGGGDHAFLLTRPWIDRGIRVEVADPDDPTPYWLVSTRYPDAVASAVGHTGASTSADEGTEDGQEAREAGRGDDLD